MNHNIRKLFAPFLVLKFCWHFAIWWTIIIITLIGPIVDALLQEKGKFDYFIQSGTLYYSVITLLFSFCVTNSIELLFVHVHDKEQLAFLPYYITTLIFSIIDIVILIFLYIYCRSNAALQIGISSLGYIFSFYLYCISHMMSLKQELSEYSVSYDEQRRSHSNAMSEGSQDKSSDGLDLQGGDLN